MDSNKRVLLAVVLCLGILFGWQYFFPNYSMIQQAPPAQNQAQPQPQPQPQPQTPAKPDIPLAMAEPLAGQPIIVTTPLYKAVLNSSGAVLEHFSLLGYKASIAASSPDMDLIAPVAQAKAPLGLILDGKATWRDVSWSTDAKDTTVAPGQSVSLTFTGTLGDIALTRTLTFNASTYLISDAVTLTSKTPATARLAFTLAAASLTGGEDNYNPTVAISLENNKLNEMGDPTKLKDGKTIASGCKWVAVTSNYFIGALLPRTDTVFKLQYVDGATRMAAEKDSINLPAGQPVQLSMDYYLGPKSLKAISDAPNDLKKSLDYGWFHIVAEALLWLLHFLYGYVGNYGVAIIILTVFIKAIFWPLSQKSYKSMEKMRKLQPMMAAIREKYPKDRNKMNEELMQLYKTYKVNPAGGCLPMVVQIPVFFGLYQALLNSIELRHAPFISHVPFTDIIWLADLSAKDPYYITPLIMGATMFIQQKMTPAPGDPTQAKIMMFMPVIFTFMFLNFPSGLVVYWLVNNVLSIAQQWLLMRESRGPSPQKA